MCPSEFQCRNVGAAVVCVAIKLFFFNPAYVRTSYDVQHITHAPRNDSCYSYCCSNGEQQIPSHKKSEELYAHPGVRVLKYAPPIHSIPLWPYQSRTFTSHSIRAQVTPERSGSGQRRRFAPKSAPHY